MVAYTTPDCLPYFEGLDSPCVNTGSVCDPSTVWCDFAEGVEARLTELDAIVARTATSTPIAWVETLGPYLWTVGQGYVQIPFDTVRVDTDNMVNLDTHRSGFIINTPGIYLISGFAVGQADTSGGSISPSLQVTLTPPSSAYGVATINTITTDFDLVVQDALITLNIHMAMPIQAGQTAFVSIGGGGTVGDTVTYSQFTAGAAWMGDLP